MGLITWNTDTNAPGCPGEILSEDGRSVLIQTDYDYPCVASTFGWDIKSVQRKPSVDENYFSESDEPIAECDHDNTDGTVDCKCGVKAIDFISAAGEWLRDNDGVKADDPGYFNDIKMPSGSSYCYECADETAHDEEWETVVYSSTGTEVVVGQRHIDGSPCTVFKCEDGMFRAVTTASVRS